MEGRGEGGRRSGTTQQRDAHATGQLPRPVGGFSMSKKGKSQREDITVERGNEQMSGLTDLQTQN